MKKRGDLSFIDKIEELRAIPKLMVEVMQLLNEPHFVSIRSIAEKIQLDPAIVTFILKFCNSELFGLRTCVRSIMSAITLFGISTIRSILTSYFMRNIYKPTNECISKYLWEHAVSVALTAEELAKHLHWGVQKTEDAYLAGLFHDLGKLVIYMHEPESYEKIVQEVARERKSFLSLELKNYGYTHVETGYYLLNKWEFSDLLKDAVLYHHDFHNYSGSEEFVKLVAFANSTVHYSIEENEGIPDEFLKLFGMSEEDYKILLERLSRIIEDVRKIFME